LHKSQVFAEGESQAYFLYRYELVLMQKKTVLLNFSVSIFFSFALVSENAIPVISVEF